MSGHLSQPRIQELVQAAVASGVLAQPRALWFAGIDPGFIGTFTVTGQSLPQLILDLNQLNDTERLADGSVPIVQYLHNVADFLRLARRPEAALFDRAANDVENATQGVTAPLAPSAVPEIVKQEAIVHQDDMVSIAFLPAALAVARSVGRVSVPRFDSGAPRLLSDGEPWVMNGSGWLAAPDLLVTNHHVVNAREQNEPRAAAADFTRQGEAATVEFDFDGAGGGATPASIARVEIADPALDYAVLRLAASPNRPPLRLRTAPFALAPGDRTPVNIIQHPRGKAKMIAFRNNLVSGMDAQTLRYFTDTDFGSSGAPVCDDGWEVVALHRGAVYVDNVNFQGKATAYVNFGTRTDVLLADLAQRASAIRDEIVAAQ